MATDFAAILAAKRGGLLDPIKNPPKAESVKEIPQTVFAADPKAVRFFGPPSAKIWIDGRDSGKRFGPDGAFTTPLENEISQLTEMYGVRREK